MPLRVIVAAGKIHSVLPIRLSKRPDNMLILAANLRNASFVLFGFNVLMPPHAFMG